MNPEIESGVAARQVVDHRGRRITLAGEDQRRKAVARFASMSPLSAGLPLTLSGGFTLSEVNAFCDRCGGACTSTRGTAKLLFPHLVLVEGMGFCEPCMMLTPIQMRVHHRTGEEPQMVWQSYGKWLHCPMAQLEESWLDRALSWLRSALGRLLHR